MSAWLALIESNTSGTGRLFARTARQRGYRPVVLTRDPERYPYLIEDDLAVLQTDTTDVPGLIRACRGLALADGLAGVTSSSEYYVATAAAVARALQRPGPPPEAIQLCRNKGHQRLRLQQAGVAVPAFQLVSTVAAASSAAEQMGYPVVVKPISGSGSTGVRLCSSQNEVHEHAERLLGQQANERGLSVPDQILIETFVEGDEYSVELFDGEVIGITRKYLGRPPYFVEVGHDFPASLSSTAANAMRSVSKRALAAVGLIWGPVHLELRLTASAPVIIEINPRLAGGFIPELVRLAQGIDLIDATIQRVVGQMPALQPRCQHHAAIRFLLSPHPGRFTGLSGTSRAAAMPGVVAVHAYKAPGQIVSCHGDFRDRVGHIIIQGDSVAQTLAVAEQARAVVEVTLD